MDTALQHRIRERAYEMWDAGGRIHGKAEQHWLAAEREILAQVTAETPASKPATARQVTRQRQPVVSIQWRAKNAAKAG
jgi:hypothetical protein